MVDIIIPLGTGSKSDNDELRLLLRSIEKNGCGYRRIIVVATEIPSWLQNVVTLKMDDCLRQNKDGNIIRKVLFALTECYDISPEFVWTCDDCVVLKKTDFSLLPPITNARKKSDFPADGSIWQRRVRRTFEFFEKRSFPLEHNYESHTPQIFPSRKLLRAMRGVNFEAGIGYSINTLFYGLLGVSGGFDQSLFKVSAETTEVPKLNRHFVGYNDKAFHAGLREKLFELFPDKSTYER